MKTTLQHYIWENNIRIKDMAEAIGCSRSYLSLIVHGKVPVSGRIAYKIDQYSAGVVKASDLLDARFLVSREGV